MQVRTVFPLVALAVAAATTPLAAQEPAPIPCRDRMCVLLIDWGPEGTPAFTDRRYGSPSEFEQRVIAALTAAGYRFAPATDATAFRLRLRPRFTNALCDRVSGLDPDTSCRTIGELTVDFPDPDASVKLPSNLRIRNRCGSDQLMDIEQFSRYVAAMLDFTLAQDKDRKRPVGRC